MSLKWWMAALLTVAALFLNTYIFLCYVTLGPASGRAPPSALDFFCRLNEIRCPSKIRHCIQILELCNGIIDCPDGSDENATFCKAYDCSGKDPPPPYVVIGTSQRPVFTNQLKKCPSGNMCTMVSVNNDASTWGPPWLCDGVKHCADGSDEDLSYCEKLHRDMAANNCTLRTPGVYDAFVDLTASYPYINDICPSRTHCVLKEKLCDRKRDCPDGSDEWPSFCMTFGCFDNVEFRCKDWGCLIKEDQICNGVEDCVDGSDEDPEFCKTYECPMSNGKKCPDDCTCLKDSQICDGSQTCPDGSDEEPSFCIHHKCSGGRYKCKDGIQCSNFYESKAAASATTMCSSGMGEPLACKDKSDAFNGLCRFLGPSGFDCGDLAKCPGGDGCVGSELLCDGKIDCRDGSDEGEFCKTYNCFIKDNCEMSGRDIAGERRPIMCMKNTTCVCGLLCNGWIDCEDKSDEDPTFCRTYDCPFGFRKCPNYPYQCVPENSVCDGSKDCLNGGDEDPSLCKNLECQEGHTRVVCANNTHQCLVDSGLCDGEKDCQNGGDEAPEFCKTFKCPAQTTKFLCGTNSYQCIKDELLCDGYPHGIDGCDESPAFCENYKCVGDMTKCPTDTYRCIQRHALCNGLKDCPNGGDEDPSLCKNFECRNGSTRVECAEGAYQCLHNFELCNGYQECMNGGGDEAPEFCETFQCPDQTTKVPCENSYKCIYNGWLCDGFTEGFDGCDENPAFCKNYTCHGNRTKCPNSATHQCVFTAALCDGFEDCIDDGADENPEFCTLYSPNTNPEPPTSNQTSSNGSSNSSLALVKRSESVSTLPLFQAAIACENKRHNITCH